MTTPSKDPKETKARIEEGLAMADGIAARMARRMNGMIEVDDAIQTARVALVVAAQRFEPERGVPFRVWAARRIRGAIIDSMRAYTGFTRTQARTYARLEEAKQASTGTHERLRYTMKLFAEPETQKDLRQSDEPPVSVFRGEVAERLIEHHHISGPLQEPPQQNDQKERAQIAEHIIEKMVTEERKILQSHYLEGKTFTAISHAHQTSRSWISRRHKRALADAQYQARCILSLEVPREHDDEKA